MSTRAAAIVLAGGGSTRMGTDKASLDWHGTTLLRRAVGIAHRAVDGPVIVVRAAGQRLPLLPDGVELAQDARPDRGPLEGLAAGLDTLGDRAEVAYLTAVDAPFLHPALVRRVLELLGPDHDVALPHAHGYSQPLAAAYRAATVAPPLEELLRADGPLGTRELLRRCRVASIREDELLADAELAAHDPELLSLHNLNEPGEFERARRRPAPTVSVSVDGGAPRLVRAATLGAAARAARCELAPEQDPEDPLVAGDVVALSAARAGPG
jgi:molybdopterin-guanine dinucleotide biosynthesis protein A